MGSNTAKVQRRQQRVSRLRAYCALVVAILLIGVLISIVLPWAGTNGYAGEVIQQNFRNDRDATALFYTESERIWELQKSIANARHSE
ncbi:MAG: hypothetical protein HY706_04835 [Candidatus Hydrogenedentes bacterium]|nr:hypothetical protein [Candidatus Hydrogenedentota bacterium]